MASQFEPSSDRQTATTAEAREFNGIKSNKKSGIFLVKYREMSNEHAARRFGFRTTDPGLIPKQIWIASKNQRPQPAMEKPPFKNSVLNSVHLQHSKSRHPGILSVLYAL